MVGCKRGGVLEGIRRLFFITKFFIQPAERVMNQWQSTQTLIRQISCRCLGTLQQLDRLRHETRTSVVMREVKLRLQVASNCSAIEMSRPPIERIKLQRGLKQQISFASPAEFAQSHHLQVARTQIVRVKTQRPIQMQI